MIDSAHANQLLEELRKSYLAEMPSRIDELELLVVNLMDSEDFEEAYDALFRSVHSLKGSAGTYGFHIISSICHRLEDHLRLVDGEVGSDATSMWLEHVDLMRCAVDAIAAGRASFTDIENALDSIRARAFSEQWQGLIIEQSRSTAALCEQVLSSLPIRCVVMDDGFAALQRLLQERFDILVTGSEIDKLNGPALIAAVRLANGVNKNLKSVLLTSRPESMFYECVKPDLVLKKGANLSRDLHVGVKELLGGRAS